MVLSRSYALLILPLAFLAISESVAVEITLIGIGGIFILTYTLIAFFKPSRRCKSCGEVFSIGFVAYIKSRLGLLKCPRCGAHVKHTHVH